MKSTTPVNTWLVILSAILPGVLSVPTAAQQDPYIAAATLLNREDDCSPLTNSTQVKCGINLDVQTNNNQGSAAFEIEVGMLLASRANGTGQTPAGQSRGYAGQNQGGGTVLTGARYPALINAPGNIVLGGGAQWLPQPQASSDGQEFLDPTRGLPQPRPWAPGDPRWGIDGPAAWAYAAAIAGGPDASTPTLLLPGVYYSVAANSSGLVVANGQPVLLGPGHFRFEPAAGELFGEFVFIGGLLAPGGAVNVHVGPGLYFFAGAQESSNKPGDLFRLSNGSTFSDGGPIVGPGLDAGQLFVFSDARLRGIAELIEFIEAGVDHNLSDLIMGSTGFAALRQGVAGLQGPNNGHISVNVHGLTDQAPVDVSFYRNLILWQDRNNSIVDYTDEDGVFPGNIFCGNFSPGCSNTGQPRRDENQNPLGPERLGDRLNSSFAAGESTEMVLHSSPDVRIRGVIYQPRGAFLTIVGAGGTPGVLQIVAGAMRIKQNASLKLSPFAN